MPGNSEEQAARLASTEPGETRSSAEILDHYRVEKELAARLRDSTRQERRTLYASVYDELVERVEARLSDRPRDTDADLAPIARYLSEDVVFLDVGAGDCAVALAVAKRVRKVHALEVSSKVTAGASIRGNVHLHLTDGVEVPLEPGSVTLAYSNQVLEHVHPADARDHVRNIHAALAPGGRFVCLTPNRLTGPADISRHFDDVPTGFHLREYTVGEVASLMRAAGFERVRAWTTRKGHSLPLPWLLVNAVEHALDRLPRTWARRLGEALPVRVIVGAYVVATKAG